MFYKSTARRERAHVPIGPWHSGFSDCKKGYLPGRHESRVGCSRFFSCPHPPPRRPLRKNEFPLRGGEEEALLCPKAACAAAGGNPGAGACDGAAILKHSSLPPRGQSSLLSASTPPPAPAAPERQPSNAHADRGSTRHARNSRRAPPPPYGKLTFSAPSSSQRQSRYQAVPRGKGSTSTHCNACLTLPPPKIFLSSRRTEIPRRDQLPPHKVLPTGSPGRDPRHPGIDWSAFPQGLRLSLLEFSLQVLLPVIYK